MKEIQDKINEIVARSRISTASNSIKVGDETEELERDYRSERRQLEASKKMN